MKDIPSAFAGDVNVALAQGSTAVLAEPDRAPGTLENFASRLAQWLRSPRPYLMLLGFALFLGFWYLTVEVWKLPRFSQMPGPTAVITEWLDPAPVYGLSIYSPEYYQHIWVSTRRVSIAFLLATATGVPLGLFLGWSQRFKEYVFPVFELLRPIPPLAWIPLSILWFGIGDEQNEFIIFLGMFFPILVNTIVGVKNIDPNLVRAARSLGARVCGLCACKRGGIRHHRGVTSLARQPQS